MPEQILDQKREKERSEDFDKRLKKLIGRAKSAGSAETDIAPIALVRLGDQFHKSPEEVTVRLHALWIAG